MILRAPFKAPLLAAFLVAACLPSADAPGGQPIRVAAIGEVASLDPLQAESPAELALAAALHQGLLMFNGGGQIVPALAESWRVSDDGLSYIFRLRQAKWPDGTMVTAADVVHGLQRIALRHPQRIALCELDAIENADAVRRRRLPARALGVHALTDDVVELKLSRPSPAMLALLAQPTMAIVRERTKRSGEGHGRKAGAPEGLGFYRLQEPAAKTPADGSWLLVGRQASGDRSTARPPIAVSPLEPSAAIEAFGGGRADVVTGGGVAGLEAARAAGGAGAWRSEPTFGVYGFVMNSRRGALADVRVRRALAMAVDRDALVGRLLASTTARPVVSLAPPTLSAYQTPAAPDWATWSIDQRQFEARRLLIEAGYGAAAAPGLAPGLTPAPSSGPSTLSLSVSLVGSPEDEAIVRFLADNWRPLGVRLNIAIRSRRSHAAALQKGTYDLALDNHVIGLDLPTPFLKAFGCGAVWNSGGYCNVEADQLVKDAESQPDIAQRTAKILQAEALMLAEAPYLPLFVPPRWTLLRGGFTGWTATASGQEPLAALERVAK